MEEKTAFVHARSDNGTIVNPMLGGDPEMLLRLVAICLEDTIDRNPKIWRKARKTVDSVLQKSAPKGARLQTVLIRIAATGLTVLAFVGLFVLGYYLKMRAGA